MRHGSVDYFTADGTPLPPHAVPLNEAGRTQADAAGALFAAAGVRFDHVLVSTPARCSPPPACASTTCW
jgi:probable phosphoglycerate mutase